MIFMKSGRLGRNALKIIENKWQKFQVISKVHHLIAGCFKAILLLNKVVRYRITIVSNNPFGIILISLENDK
jgi:hypothetical protein